MADVLHLLDAVVGQRKHIELDVVVEALDRLDVVVVCVNSQVQRSSSRRLVKYYMHSIFFIVP